MCERNHRTSSNIRNEQETRTINILQGKCCRGSLEWACFTDSKAQSYRLKDTFQFLRIFAVDSSAIDNLILRSLYLAHTITCDSGK